MFYHATLQFEGIAQTWSNYEKNDIVKDLLIPFINGQVIVIDRDGERRILNMKNVTLLTVYKTQEWLELPIESDGENPNYGLVDEDVLEKALKGNECTDEIVNEVRSTEAIQPMRSILQ